MKNGRSFENRHVVSEGMADKKQNKHRSRYLCSYLRTCYYTDVAVCLRVLLDNVKSMFISTIRLIFESFMRIRVSVAPG